MTTFLPIRTDDAALAAYAQLLSACFPTTDKFTPAYLQWLYRDNPDGVAVGFDAWQDEQLAAHYVCIAARAHVHGAPVPVLLSLNTATHPAHQGKGLFTRLATLTYAAGASQGYHGVYGVANANSTPGFLRKLDFQLVRPLEARIGLGRLPPRRSSASQRSFARLWDQRSLAWRAACPGKPLQARPRGALWQVQATALSAFVPAYAELDAAHLPAALALPGAHATFSPVRLFLGLRPDADGGYGRYMSIPQRLRPSPLNLIWLPLAGSTQLAPEAIDFSFLDFDAY